MKPPQKRFQQKTLPAEAFTYGRPLRPQTPVNTVMQNQFGDEAEFSLQNRYKSMKQQKAQSKGPMQIRKTNAQIHADNAVAQKNAPVEPRAQFKLKRFQDVNPRTSTKRGDNAYMVQGGR